MNILVVEPMAASGHRNSNSFFLKVLSEIGSVTLATFFKYQHHFDVANRINIPDRFNRPGSTIGTRINQIRILSYVLRQSKMCDNDLTFFLCYEEISLAIRWPKRYRTLVFEHNNIDNIVKRRLKAFFYKRIGRNVIHLAYMDYIVNYITSNYGKEAHNISHPYYGKNLTAPSLPGKDSPVNKARKPIVIFSPSGSNEPAVVKTLINFVSKNKDYRLIAKGNANEAGLRYELITFFNDYNEQMRNCDYVFFGGRYEYRVSGVVFEALSFGKPAILLDCLFARELQKRYPCSIFPVKDIHEIKTLELKLDGIAKEQERFLQEHSFDEIKAELAKLLAAKREI